MERLDRVLTVLERLLLGATLLGASAILFGNVVLRYFFAKGLVWAEEAVRYLIIWMVLIGGARAARTASHINVDVLLNLLPERLRRMAVVGVFGLASLFCAALSVWGWVLVGLIRASGQITPGLQMPMYWAYLAIPLGAALMVIRFLQAAWEQGWRGDQP